MNHEDFKKQKSYIDKIKKGGNDELTSFLFLVF